MPYGGRFALAFGFCAVLVVAAVAGTISRRDVAGLPLGELLRVESVPAERTSRTGDHLQFMSEIFAGTRRFTEADLDDRFTPALEDEGLTADILNSISDQRLADYGAIRFIRVLEQDSEFVRVLGVGEEGTPLDVFVFLKDGRIEWFEFQEDETDPRRLATWQSTLILLLGMGLLTVAAVAWRYRAGAEVWIALAALGPTLAGVLVLSDLSLAYTIGRVGPGLGVIFAAALLIGPTPGRGRQWVLGAAAVAALLGAVAPFLRDSSLIGHPTVVGAFRDNENLLRASLASSAAATVLAMCGAAAMSLGQVGRTAGRKRQPSLIAAALAVLLAVAALGATVDYAVGDGALASGLFKAVALSALVLIPAAVLVRLLVSRWERAELATLVIDLESESVDLRPAVGKALEDPSLKVLTSPDGEVLVDDAGEEVSLDAIPDERVLTRIQSGDQLVGGLIHDAALQRDHERLEAVAAAAGMALQLSRLNKQVVAQLDEVNASRARILQASDTARRQVERDLHDGAQQRLVALGLRMQGARRLVGEGDQDQLVAFLEEATRDIQHTISDIRAVSRGAQPALLAERGLATAVDALAERAPVPVRLDITSEQLSVGAERTAYFLIAEALTNMAKHARATSAQVSVTRGNGDACITIRDDGLGGAEISPGSGLEGLNDRIAAIGGTFTISSGSGGTTLTANIPCS